MGLIRRVLPSLREHKLFIKLVKCFWAKRNTDYLGFVVGSSIARRSPPKVATVKDLPVPKKKMGKVFYGLSLFLS
jgi:hypothetical protein